MKILILGAGAVGGYFGGRMRAIGLDVGFIVREARAAALRENGLTLATPEGEERIGDLRVHISGEPLPDADILLIATKATGLGAAIASLRGKVHDETLIVPLLNGLPHIGALVDAFGDEAVAGGVCYIQASVTDAGVIRRHNHIQKIVVGARHDHQVAPLKKFVALAAPAGFDIACEPDVKQTMWSKVAFLATLAGATCLARGAVGEIVATRHGEDVTRAMFGECLEIARVEGFALSADAVTAAEKMLLAEGSGLSSSMLGDIRAGRMTEGDHIIGDLIERAARHGIATPYLKAAHLSVSAHEVRLKG